MKKKQKELSDSIEKYHPEVNDIERNDLFRLLGDNILPFGIVEQQLWIPASLVCEASDRHRTDYSSNWAHTDRSLRGQAVRLKDKNKLNKYKKDFFERFPDVKLSIRGTTWLLDWERAYDYLSRSVYNLYKEKNVLSDRTKVILDRGILYISSFEVARQMGIKHRSLIKVTKKYVDHIELFGPLIEKKEKVIHNQGYAERIYFMFNEDQCYLLGSLARNSEGALNFKTWLVQQFSKARRLVQETNKVTNSEQVIHSQLAELTLYTSLSIQTEYPLEVKYVKGTKFKTSIKRIDLLLENSVAIELKYEKINPDHITEIISERGYFHSLKKLPNFKYLVISSPVGLTHSASKMLEVMYPKVVFKYPYEIGDNIAKKILSTYPKASHWWLRKLVFPRFNRVLSKTFFESLEEE